MSTETEQVIENVSQIITDVKQLRQKSISASEDEIKEIGNKIISALPESYLGLAAPQVGLFKRVFLANLSSGKFLFINPVLSNQSIDKIPSKEGCLSLPGISRWISRHNRVCISCDRILHVDIQSPNIWAASPHSTNQMNLKGLDSCIVQHEYDHLDGLLIIDHTETLAPQDKAFQRNQKRSQKLYQQRHVSQKTTHHVHKKNPIKTKQIKKILERKARQEAYKAGL